MTRTIIQFCIYISALTISNCASDLASIDPRWAPKLYIGSPADMGLVRKVPGSPETVKCADFDFADFRCVRTADLDRLFPILQGCRSLRELYETDHLFDQ